MKPRPLVSCITIFLNAERFIVEAVESVLAQTYDNWELILVDDGSTDSCTAIARRYAETHPDRIRYLEHVGHQNRGMSESRNLGIAQARGEYLAFLDADDVWLPRKLERQVPILESDTEAAMVCGATEYWHSWTGRPEDRDRDRIMDLGVPEPTRVEPPDLLLALYPLGRGSAPCLCSLLLRTTAVMRLGGFEGSFKGFYEDQAFLTKLYLTEPVVISTDCLDRYRIHPDSCSATVRDAGQYDRFREEFLRWLQSYFHRQGVTDHRIWDTLNDALRPYQDLATPSATEHQWLRLLRVAEGAVARLEVPSQNPDTVRIAIAGCPSRRSYDIQLNLPRLAAKSNHRYALSFLARADAPRAGAVGFAVGHAPWTNLGLYSPFDVTPEWQHFERTFVATDSESNARIHFDVGESDVPIELSAISLRSLTDGCFVRPDLPSRHAAVTGTAGGAAQSATPSVEPGRVNFGSLRRLEPISQDFGFERGRPVDRHYIEGFLAAHALDVGGRVLEVGERSYTRRFGAERVTVSDVLHVVQGDPEATIIADLSAADHIPSDSFDCIILTQTLQLIYDVSAAIRTIHRILKPGGVLLATFPGISQTYDDEWGASWYWNFTPVSAKRLFEDVFGSSWVTIETFGNVLTATSFLQGLAADELSQEELDYRDPSYSVTIAVRAEKPQETEGQPRAIETSGLRRLKKGSSEPKALVLMYHRIAEAELDPWSLCVAPERFAQQLQVLREVTRPISLGELVHDLTNGAINGRTVALTFDDGYADNLYGAAPLLRQHDVPATVFVTTGYLDSDREFWWDELESLLLSPGVLPRSLRMVIADEAHHWELEESAEYSRDEWLRDGFWKAADAPPTARHALFLSLWRLLQSLSDGEQLDALTRLRAWASRDSRVRDTHRVLTTAELKLLSQGTLIEIGAHTITHPILGDLPPTARRKELRGSRAELQERLGTAVTSFSYPYGAYRPDLVPFVKDAGFMCACSTVPESISSDADRFQLPRLTVEDWDRDEFSRRLSSWLA